MIAQIREKFQHRYNSFFGLLGVALPTLIVIFSYRFLVEGLGEVGFGIYLLTASVGNVLAFMDLGISSANIRFVAEDHASASHQGLVDVVQTSAVFYLLLGMIVTVVVAIFSKSLIELLSFPAEYSEIGCLLLFLAALQMAIYLVANVYIGVLKALGRFDLAVVVNVFIPFVTLGLGGVAVKAGLVGLLGLMWFGVLGALFGLLISFYLSDRVCSALGVSLFRGRARIKTLQRMYGFSALLTLHSMASIFFSQVQKILIGSALGPASVGIFQFPYTALTKIHSFINAGSEFIYPLASSEKSIERLRGVYLRVLLITAVTAFISLASFCLASNFIFTLWLGAGISNKVAPLVPSLALALFFVALAIPGHHVLNGLGRPWLNVAYSCLNVAIYLGCFFAFDSDLNLTSFSYAYAVSNVISGLIFQVALEFYIWPRLREKT